MRLTNQPHCVHVFQVILLLINTGVYLTVLPEAYSAPAPGAPASGRHLMTAYASATSQTTSLSRQDSGAPWSSRALIAKSDRKQQAPADSPFVNFGGQDELDRLSAQIKKLCARGEYGESLKLAEKALQLTESEFGAKHLEYARALNNLAWHEQMTGNYTAARGHFDQSLKRHEEKLGQADPRLVPVLNNLGMLLCFQGDASAAVPLLSRALSLEEKAFGTDSIDLVPAMNNLATVLAAAGNQKQSMQILQRASVLQSKDANPDNEEMCLTLGNLALLHEKSGDLKEAEVCLNRVLELRRKSGDTTSSTYAESLNNVAMVELAVGKSSEAMVHLKESLAVSEKSSGKDHIDLVTTLNNLAVVESLHGAAESARERTFAAATIVDRHIQNVLPSLSFSEQKSFLATRLPRQISTMLSVCKEEADSAKLYSYLLRWKGLLIECLRWQSQLGRVLSDKDLATEARQLLEVRNEISKLFHSSGDMDFEVWKARTAEKTKVKEALERKLAEKSGATAASDVLSNKSVSQFAALLRPDEQLVDIYAYSNLKNNPAYAAFFLSPDGQVKISRVDDATTCNASIAQWRENVVANRTDEADWQQVNRTIGTLVASKLSPSVKRLFISPDAALARIPLSLLQDVQSTEVSELDSPRELAYIREGAAEDHGATAGGEHGTLLCIGDLSFGNSQAGLVFPALPGTRKELTGIMTLALRSGMKARMITGSDAKKETVINALPLADCAHIATHGFFSKGGFSAQLQELKFSTSKNTDSPNAAATRTPLAESGLVLSCDEGGKSPDLLTAEEIIGINPGRCKSVVLSACETGLGSAESGQGVLGLRASFIAAGVNRLVLSLWKVPDASSTYLMEQFYTNLLITKQPPAVALKNAQNAVRNAPYGAFKNPVHWMGWVLVGEGW